jgi:hypothetical protein
MHQKEISKHDLSIFQTQVIPEGKINVLPFSFYAGMDHEAILHFMAVYGIYVLPTTELIDWLRNNIIGTTIEIGCGNGAIGRALGIPITDSKMQEKGEIKMYYNLVGQEPVSYPKDVIQLDGNEAVKKYNPDTVITAFVTHKFNGVDGNMFGVVEGKILQQVKRYISISNEITHAGKPILKHPHQSYHFPWLITRALDQSKNVIWVFDGKKK